MTGVTTKVKPQKRKMATQRQLLLLGKVRRIKKQSCKGSKPVTKTPTGVEEKTESKASYKVVESRRKARTSPIKQVQKRTTKPSSAQKSTESNTRTKPINRTRTSKTKE